MTKKELEQRIKVLENNWEILKTYLKVKEEEYPVLESKLFFNKYGFADHYEYIAVKKIRLVKINNKQYEKNN